MEISYSKLRPFVTIVVLTFAFLCIVINTLPILFPGNQGTSECLFCFTCSPCQDPTDLEMFEQNGEFQFPPSSFEIHAYTEGLREMYTLVKFKIDGADYEDFVTGLRCKPEPTTATSILGNLAIKDQFPWWDPWTASSILGCQWSSEHFYQTILIDNSISSKYEIFITGSMR